jgi:hypothetical protein
VRSVGYIALRPEEYAAELEKVRQLAGAAGDTTAAQ